MAQEALSNVARHSRASAVMVCLDCPPGGACLEVTDNGVGFDPKTQDAGGFGLQSMRERMNGVGGSLSIESMPGSGARIHAATPIQKESA